MLATKSAHHCSSLIKFGHVLPACLLALFCKNKTKKLNINETKQ